MNDDIIFIVVGIMGLAMAGLMIYTLGVVLLNLWHNLLVPFALGLKDLISSMLGNKTSMVLLIVLGAMMLASCSSPSYGVRKQPGFRSCKSAHKAIGR